MKVTLANVMVPASLSKSGSATIAVTSLMVAERVTVALVVDGEAVRPDVSPVYTLRAFSLVTVSPALGIVLPA
jgi:hypothetical protein